MNWIIPYDGFNEADLLKMDEQSVRQKLSQMLYRDIKRLCTQYNLKVCDDKFWARYICRDQFGHDDVSESMWISIYEYLIFDNECPHLSDTIFPPYMQNLSTDVLQYLLIHMDDIKFYTLYEQDKFVKDFCLTNDLWRKKLENKFGNLEKVFFAIDTEPSNFNRVQLKIADLVSGNVIKLEQYRHAFLYSVTLIPNGISNNNIVNIIFNYKVDSYTGHGNLELNISTGAIMRYSIDEEKSNLNVDVETLPEMFNYFFIY